MPATKKKAVKKKTVKKVSAEKPSTPEGLRVRNKEIRRVRVGDIIENPHNFRGHGELQRRSFRATVDEIGYYGYQDVFEHPEHPGKVMLVDGELRKDDLVQQYGEDAYIDVNVTDFDAEDAKKALATKDPLAAMASNESQKMHELLKDMESESPAFNDLLAHLAENEGIFDIGETSMPELPDGDRQAFQVMAFTLSDDQAGDVKRALDTAKKAGPFVDSVNENSNGNALARIAEAYLGTC